jgi:hypothetical protein
MSKPLFEDFQEQAFEESKVFLSGATRQVSLITLYLLFFLSTL